MNRAEKATALLLANVGKRVTIRMMEAAGICSYTARNAVSEAKPSLEAMGFSLSHEYHKPGEFVFDNGWRIDPSVEENGQRVMGF